MEAKFTYTSWSGGRGRAAQVEVIGDDGRVTEYRWCATGGSDYASDAIPPVGWTPEQLKALALALNAAGAGTPKRPLIYRALPDYRPGRLTCKDGYFYYSEPGQLDDSWAVHVEV